MPICNNYEQKLHFLICCKAVLLKNITKLYGNMYHNACVVRLFQWDIIQSYMGRHMVIAIMGSNALEIIHI